MEIYQGGYIHVYFEDEVDLKQAVIGRDIKLKIGDVYLGKEGGPFYGKKCLVKFDSPPLEYNDDYQRIKDHYTKKGWRFVEVDRSVWVFEING